LILGLPLRRWLNKPKSYPGFLRNKDNDRVKLQ
jgi:hypothetical protein